jgi:hypothetical protein
MASAAYISDLSSLSESIAETIRLAAALSNIDAAAKGGWPRSRDLHGGIAGARRGQRKPRGGQDRTGHIRSEPGSLRRLGSRYDRAVKSNWSERLKLL